MSGVLRTECPRCRTVEVPFADVCLVFNPQSEVAPAAVEFTCPQCGRLATQRVGDRAARLLTRAGVQLVAPSTVPQVAPAGDESDRPG